MVQYIFRESPLRIIGAKRANPQKIGEALDKIRSNTRGRFNSKTIVNAARNSTNYLHRHFEWKDSIAADKYRQEQARELVGCIEVVIVDKGTKAERRMPAFISIIEKGGRQYHTVDDVLNSSALQGLALKQAERDFEAYERRLLQFADICDAIKAARELIRDRRRAIEEELPLGT
jgi:hypothetical protein